MNSAFERLARGDISALAEIDAYRVLPRLKRLSEADAQDVVQTVHEKVIIRVRDGKWVFDSAGACRRYFATMLSHALVDTWRKRRFEHPLQFDESVEPAGRGPQRVDVATRALDVWRMIERLEQRFGATQDARESLRRRYETRCGEPLIRLLERDGRLSHADSEKDLSNEAARQRRAIRGLKASVAQALNLGELDSESAEMLMQFLKAMNERDYTQTSKGEPSSDGASGSDDTEQGAT